MHPWGIIYVFLATATPEPSAIRSAVRRVLEQPSFRISAAALAQKAAHFIHGVYSNHAVDLKLGRQLVKYRQELG